MLIAVGRVACLWFSCHALMQAEPAPGAEPDPAPLLRHGETARGENLSKSLTFVTDHDLERTIGALQRSVKQRKWPVVSELLVDLQSEPSTLLVEVDGVISSAAVAAARLIDQLPEEGRAAYLRMASPLARKSLETALARRETADLLKTAQQFPQTEAGAEAFEKYIAVLVDQGELEADDLSEMAGRRDLHRTGKTSDRSRQTLAAPLKPQPAPDDLQTEFPSRIAVWEHPLESGEKFQQTVTATYQELRESGLSPFLSATLNPTPAGLIVGGAAQHVGIDPLTGQQHWQRDIAGYAARWIRHPGNLGDANRLRLFAISAARRVFDESVTSHISEGKEHFYLLESIPSDDPLVQIDSDGNIKFPANRLICGENQTGKTVWTFQGTPAGKMFFSGPPLLLGRRLFLIGESQEDASVHLVTVDATTGEQLESLILASALVPIVQDERRQGQASLLQFDAGQLLCMTAAGVVISVDPLLRQINWALRLPRSDSISNPSEADDLPIHRSGFEWWDRWQQSRMIPVDDHLVIAAPESDYLYVVNRRTGRMLWTSPRADSLHLALADQAHGVILTGKTHARRLDLRTGRQLWQTTIPQPAGQGVVAGDHYLYPILEQDAARLDLVSGESELSFESANRAPESQGVLARRIRPRHFIASGGALFELGLQELRRLQSPRQALASQPFRSRWDETVNAVERGDWSLAIRELKALNQSANNAESPQTRRTLLSLLAAAYHRDNSPVEKQRLTAEFHKLATTSVELAAWRQLQAREKIQQGDWPAAIDLWLSAPIDELDCLLPARQDDARCRLDRWFQAELTRASATRNAQAAERFTHLIEQRLAASEAVEISERRRILQCLGQTHWGQKYRLLFPVDATTPQSLATDQLALLELAESLNPEIAAGAIARLLELEIARPASFDTQRWRQRLSAFPPEQELPQGLNVGQFLKQQQTKFEVSENSGGADFNWGRLDPVVEVKTSHSHEVYLLPLPVAAPGGILTGLSLEIDFPAHRAVRFNGSVWSRPWYFELPRTNRNLRHEAATNRAWGFGEFVLLQSGSEVFGLSPLSPTGSRSCELLWPSPKEAIDTLGSRENLMLTFQREAAAQRPGFENPSHYRVDEFRHYATAVSPVRHGYFCIQQMGMLVAFDTATGQERWRRYDLPQLAFCCGNDAHVVVISPTTKTAIRYDALDGRLLEESSWPRSVREIIHVNGTQLLHVRGDRFQNDFISAPRENVEEQEQKNSAQTPPEEHSNPVVLEQLEATTGASRWKREWPRGSLPFEIDDRWLGMVVPAGNVEILEIDSGKTISKLELKLPPLITKVACSVAQNGIVMVFSDRHPFVPPEGIAQVQAGYRRPAVGGLGCCIDRKEGDLKWTIPIDDAVFPLDQPPDLPVFVTLGLPPEPGTEEEESPAEVPPDPPETDPPPPPADDVPEDAVPPDSQETTPPEFGVTLRCFDRRTGRLLHEIRGERNLFYSLTGRREQQRVRLNTVKTRIEIDFSTQVEEPAHSPSAN